MKRRLFTFLCMVFIQIKGTLAFADLSNLSNAQELKEKFANEYKNVIDDVRKSGFIVRVFFRDVATSPEIVVLVGETHVKKKSSQEALSSFLENFSVFATEGISLKAYLGGSLLRDTYFRIQDLLSYAVSGSNVETCSKDNLEFDAAQLALDSYISDLKSDLKVLALGDNKYNIFLESNHKPGIAGHAFSIAMPICLLSMIPLSLSSYYPAAQLTHLSDFIFRSTAIVSLASIPYGIYLDRDKIMARNMIEGLKFDQLYGEETIYPKILCGIVGMTHTIGIGKRLEKEGFQQLSL